MGAKGRGGVRSSHAVGRSTWGCARRVGRVLVAAVAMPFSAATASAQSTSASGPVVKVGMITSLTGPLASNPEVKDALLAAIAAFNKRGGVGTANAKLQADVCDSKGDANGEVDCARQMVDDGVVATLNDLTFNNPAGVSTSSRRPASRASASAGPTSPSSGRASRTRSRPASSPRTSVPRSASSRTATPRSASCGPTRPPARRSRASSPRRSPRSASTSRATSRSRPVPPTTRRTSRRSSRRTPTRC